MASTSAVLPQVTAFNTTTATRKPERTAPKVVYIKGLSSYEGLKAHNSVASLGRHESAAQGFARVMNSLKTPSRSRGKTGGGALSATCNEVEEIFKIAAIMNGLVLVGVAVGFVLLRIEAWVEESEI